MKMLEIIAGGKGDKTNPEDVDQKQLEIGAAVEKEHTDSDEAAKEIALDHLTEDPEYYTKLVKSGIVDEPKALEIYKKYFGSVNEKATSKAQQQAAGIAHAAQKGEIPKSKLKGASKEMAKMKPDELKKFAKTKHTGLPKHVKENDEKIRLGNLVKKEDNVQNDDPRPLTMEEKKAFLEEIKNLESYGQKLYSPVDLVELAEKLSNLGKVAHQLTLQETDDWFDKVTINRNMKEVKKISEDITKTATEAKSVQQRLTSLYEDLKHVLGRYFEINSLDDSGKPMVEDDLYNPAGQNTSFDYLKSNFEDFKNADLANKARINKAKRNIS